MEKWINNYRGFKDYDLYNLLKKYAEKWVNGFDYVPREVVRKLRDYSDYADFTDVTPYTDKEIEEEKNYCEGTYGLPMVGMWAFNGPFDIGWLDNDRNKKIMKQCGFTIYESEDYEYVFGVDGCGYDFFEAHWIPLYLARGFTWHENDKRWAEIVKKYKEVKK